MRVLGTAGHVDHGKSTLVEALTGIHPDRLKEEREREMTIDLGFAWLTLPGGEEVGIIDVPGHRDFIENMLAGVGGIDAALLVVAADESVMPQTREHLAILDLLQIGGGVVALTKIDLVDDTEWLDLVEGELLQVLDGTALENASIVRVSARTLEGIPELLREIEHCLADRPRRVDYGRPRLPIDRAFTIAGFGSVVTGTLSNGHLSLGDEVEILPKGLRGRIRGLQTHKQKEETAIPGGRTAVNITGIPVEEIHRGDVLALPGSYRPTRRLDARFRLLPDVSNILQHNTEVKLYLGAAEIVARLRLLGGERLQPGDEGWLQLELKQPVVAMRGDHYILRRPSPGETLGGGVIVDPHPARRHKRFSREVIERLEALSHGTPDEVLLQALLVMGVATTKEVLANSNLEESAGREAVLELLKNHQFINLDAPTEKSEDFPAPNDLLTTPGYWQSLEERVRTVMNNYHQVSPLLLGMPREELRSRMRSVWGANPRLFNLAVRRLGEAGQIEEIGPLVKLPGHTIEFSNQQQVKVDTLLRRFAANPYNTPSVKECQLEVGQDVYDALVSLGKLKAVSSEVVFRQEDYERMVEEIRHLFEKQDNLTAAQVRDHFNNSRKYVLALLEHLDASGITVRQGDVRRLK